MANFSLLFFVLITFLVPKVLAITNYTVGDKSGWTIGVDFSSWTIGKTFFVGDNLVFKYEKGKHNVLDVDVSSFGQCATPKDKQPMATGNDVVPLTTPGIKWFICNIANHCTSGQKLVISVETPPPPAGQAPPPPPIPTQAPPTPPTAGQAPSPPPIPTKAPPTLPATGQAPPPSPANGQAPPTPPADGQSPPPALVPALPPSSPPASPPSMPPPGRNQTAPHFPIAPTPTQNIPPSESPVPSPTTAAPPPSGAAAKSTVSGIMAVAIGVLAGIMI